MKKSLRTMLGVTLLEIMLVLAIAAMVIVMSIRYYQSASLNQKITAAMNAVIAVVAAGESVLGASGTLAGKTDPDFNPFLPGGAQLSSPWGGEISAAGIAPNRFKITIPNISPAGCNQLNTLVEQNSKLSGGTCPSGNSSGSFVITVTE